MRFFNTIKSWRLHKKLTQEKLAEACSTGKSYISMIESGKRPYNQELLELISKALATPTYKLISMTPEDQSTEYKIQLRGSVAANGSEHFMSDYLDGGGSEEEEIPSTIKNAYGAYRVSGQSMMPRYRPGEIIIVGEQTTAINQYINHDVVAYIDDNAGRPVLKTLKTGRDNLWTLKSINPVFDDITDTPLLWVAPVLWVKL